MKSKDAIKEAAGAEVPASEYIPYSAHVAPNVIRLRGNGDLLAMWRLEGVAFETADQAQIMAWKEAMVNFLRALGGGQWALWSHKIRRQVHDTLDGEYRNAFCADFARQYERRLVAGRQMATELYLSVIYRGGSSAMQRMFSFGRKSVRDRTRERIVEEIDIMNDMGAQLEASLARYQPERLGTRRRGDVVTSDMLSVLSFLANGYWDDVPLKEASLNEYLPSSRLFFGEGNGMVEIWHPSGRQFGGFLDMQEYPALSEPGMNNALLYSDCSYVETQSFSIISRRAALDTLKRQQGHLDAAADAAGSEVHAMNQAMDEVASGHIVLGEYHYSLLVFGASLEAVSKAMGEARTALQDGPGFKMALIDAIPEAAWFAQLPGNWSLRPREAHITSRNFACLSPLHNFAAGKRTGNPWGRAIALMDTPSAQPYYFNFHASPDAEDSQDEKYSGNTFVCGTTGSGKTTMVAALFCLAMKVPGLRIVMLDKDRGMEIGVRQMGGRYLALKVGERTGFNPLQLEPTERNIQFCETLIKLLVNGSEAGLRPAEEQDIARAVRTVMSAQVSRELRRLSMVQQLLPVTGDNPLRDRLRKWVEPGSLGWVFDNPHDEVKLDTNVFGFDYTEFLDVAEVRTPVIAYLLHRIEELIDGTPFIFHMTEFWKPLMDRHFVGFARDKLKTIRKLYGLGVFDTQSPSDVLINAETGEPHPVGKTVVEQCITKIFLPNPAADKDDYVNGFKLTEAEFEFIRAMPENARLALIKQGQRSAVVKFDLGGLDGVLPVLSGSLDNVELVDRIRAELGDEPQAWLPEFLRQVQERRARARGDGKKLSASQDQLRLAANA